MISSLNWMVSFKILILHWVQYFSYVRNFCKIAIVWIFWCFFRVWRAFCMAVSFDILGIIPGKPVERLWTMRPAALWIGLLAELCAALVLNRKGQWWRFHSEFWSVMGPIEGQMTFQVRFWEKTTMKPWQINKCLTFHHEPPWNMTITQFFWGGGRNRLHW